MLLLASLAGLAFLSWRGVQRLRQFPPRGWFQAVALVGFFLAGLAFAYWIAWWIPALSSLTAQTASMVLRFGAGYFVAVAGWVGLLRVLASLKPQTSRAAAGAPLVQ